MKTKPTRAEDHPLWELWAPETPRLDAIEARTPQMRAAHKRVEWRHFQALMAQGIPARELVGTFGIVTVQGREMIVTESRRLRAYLTGPCLFGVPHV